MPLIDANGTVLHYELTGPAHGPVVVFSNSIGSTLEMWEAQVRALSGRYRCLTYDTRGHGRSAVVGRDASIDDLADDLAGLLDALGIQNAHVLGLSLGGMTAQAFGVRHAHRTKSLVLMATAAQLGPPEAWEQRAQAVRSQGMAAIADAVLARWFTPALAAEHGDVVTSWRERFLAIDPDGYAACCAAIRDMDLREAIRAITAPTLIIAGAEDPSTPPPLMEDIRARIPDAELIVIPRAAHLLAVERPDAVNAHLRAFFDRQEGGEGRRGATFEAGYANRKSVLGPEHVERSFAKAGPFATPWHEFITRVAWGDIWGDPTLPWKTRSMLTLTMMIALHREEEFKLHLRPALRNGVTLEELRAMLLQSSIYAGVPAANAAFRWVREVLGDELD
jgi:3-oxoadipate enol-lactonase/4-carboxymuconolactone decarboxylase